MSLLLYYYKAYITSFVIRKLQITMNYYYNDDVNILQQQKNYYYYY